MTRVVVLGDALLDRDLVGRADRLAPDAPVPVLDVESVHERPGGAGLTSLLCAGPGVDVTCVAPIADDDAGRRLRTLLDGPVHLVALPQPGTTRTKTRVRSAGQSVLRLDDGGPGRPGRLTSARRAEVRAALESADAVLVSDYGAGTSAEPVLRELLSECVTRRVPVVWDPHPRGARPVPGLRLVTPNRDEARRFADRSAPPAAEPEFLAALLRADWGAAAVAVTAGGAGAYLSLPGSEPVYVPGRPVEADPCGAGDRFAASAALALARGALVSEAVVGAVHDASAWLSAGGLAQLHRTGPARRRGTDRGLDGVAAVRARGGTVVATGGCFDVLHVGHVACLAAARQAGDALVVMLNSDESVRRAKGAGRPVHTQDERARMLLALESVDSVVVFDEDDPRRALDRLRPDVWVKGSDYAGAELPEAGLVRSWGGRVLLLPYLDGHSTSAILQEIR